MRPFPLALRAISGLIAFCGLSFSQRINFDITVPVVQTVAIPTVPFFQDVTDRSGIDARLRWKKYGSPAVADLDRDGYPDLLLCHHDSTRAELYFNNRDGTFSKSSWKLWYDNHGFSITPITARERGLYFTLSVGGNYGKTFNHPRMFAVDPYTRAVEDVSKKAGVQYRGGRGRSAVFMDLSMGKHTFWPDVIFLNARNPSGSTQFAYENIGEKKFMLRTLKGGLANDINWYATVTDLENDGVMEVITYWDLRMWRLVAPFKFEEITGEVFPGGMKRKGVVSVAEIDFDNDGDFDLYVARTKSGDLSWQSGSVFEDYLLENRNGVYYDVSDLANIPRKTTPRGVTVGDFNNDGWMDLYVTQYREADNVLLNNGDGTFTSVSGLTFRPSNVRGDHAVAVDYDLDGRVDVISGQGDQIRESLGGSFRIFQNLLPRNTGNYLLVRVGNAWDRSCTPLHAVVAVEAGSFFLKRRVGTAGSAVSQSYLETVHFGLGSVARIDVIYVKYTNGYVDVRRNLKANQLVFMGVV
ncbi:unnamed protein product [Agarophyton chilense]